MPEPPGGSRVGIVVPLTLQMGWAEIPACFCATTGTDLLLGEGVDLPKHPLGKLMAPAGVPPTAPPDAAEQMSVGVRTDNWILGVVKK